MYTFATPSNIARLNIYYPATLDVLPDVCIHTNVYVYKHIHLYATLGPLDI